MNGGSTTPYARWLRTTTETWARATGHMTNGVLEANRAVLAAYGFDGAGTSTDADGATASAESGVDSTETNGDGTGAGTASPDSVDPSGSVAMSATTKAAHLAGDEEAGWDVEYDLDDEDAVAVGDSVRFSKPVDEADVLAFARASGDTNPLHLDDEFAEGTRFGRRIVHGTLVSGLISAALARLPGLTIYVSQDVRFLRPVDIGGRLTAVVTVDEDLGDARYKLSTDVFDAEERPVIEGEAVVLVDPEAG
ncbi:MaoC family dehydratase [Halobium salinum]|uniref:MaoC family dehydratase n=1 Tax=Halobium salinum TaxID=1364940 RepID=A0ABD5PB36_9EURY|nr:MaoC family dehydratase [Halobium salinum]